MARGKTSIVLITVWLLLMSLVALCTSIFGDAWYVNEVTAGNVGLLKRCYYDIYYKRKCKYRKVLTFKKENFTLDFILIGLLHSMLFTFCGLLYAIAVFCCQKNTGAWKVCKILIVIFTIIAAVLAIVSMAYSERSERYENPSVKRGWTATVGWVAVGESIAACVFAFLLACIKPQQENVVNGQMLYETGSAGSTGSDEFEMR